MNRITLTSRTEKTLPVNINGQDIDLTFDAGSLETKNAIVTMLDDILKYQDKGKGLFNKNDAFSPESVSVVRAFTNEGLDLCRTLSATFASLFPKWSEVVGNNFIDLDVYSQLLGAMMQIVTEKETEEKVAEEIGDER